ncbi:MAG: FAD:protein FMN transferase [Lachnospiraceae bacterium]|nr:FAD:protein FMN transferase [Lachnospiraceae bacterium]
MLKKRLVVLAGILCIAVILGGCGKKKEELSVSRTSYALNTEVQIQLFGTDDEELLTDCLRLCNEYEKKLSRTMENSEIWLLNKEKEYVVSDETLEVIKKGLYYSKLSGGAFDITIEPISSLWDFTAKEPKLPDADRIAEYLKYVDYSKVQIDGNRVALEKNMGLDLGAIAKGYIADRLKDYILEQGIESAYINLGGNVLCVGEKLSGEAFRIGIRDPQSNSKLKAVISVSDKSVVTSGDYQRYMTIDGKKYHHILNPRTGYSYENNLSSVTIISDLSVDGDGLSTTCFALGLEKGLELINSLDNVWAMFIDSDGNITYSDGFKENIPCKEY